jgi:hypothetical protein
MMKQTLDRLEFDVKIWLDKLNDCQNMEVFGKDGRIKLKLILKKRFWEVWARIICLRKKTVTKLFWFYKMREIFWPTMLMLNIQE